MSTYFVASTGTGVGKTFTTCAMVHALRARGINAKGYKPVISGWNAQDEENDTAQIKKAGGNSQTLDEISGWRFAAPLSPHRAAALEGKTLDMVALKEWTQVAKTAEVINFIETVGGVMVPLTNTATTLDWMADANLPVILVVGSYLGTISHTLTALHALRARQLHVAALVMNETPGSSVTLDEAQAGLAPFIGDIALRVVQPIVSSWQRAHAVANMTEKLG